MFKTIQFKKSYNRMKMISGKSVIYCLFTEEEKKHNGNLFISGNFYRGQYCMKHNHEILSCGTINCI